MAEASRRCPSCPTRASSSRRCSGSRNAAGGWPSSGSAARRNGGGTHAGPTASMALRSDFLEAATRLMLRPDQLVQAHARLWQDYLTLWHHTAQRMLGQAAEPVIEPAKDDRRFKSEAWQDPRLRLHQAGLPAQRALPADDAVRGSRAWTRAREAAGSTSTPASSSTRSSPSNFALTNPEVLRGHRRERRQNLVKGLREPARRPRARPGQAQGQDDGHRGVRARPEHRDHARQGGVPERADAADPVRADDEAGRTSGRC